MNMLIIIILAVSSAKRLIAQDNHMDWQGTTTAVCELRNQTKILQGQRTISKNFVFQNSILEGTLEFQLYAETDFKIYIDNIQYAPEQMQYSGLFCTETKYLVQYRIIFKTVSQGFSLQINSDGIIEIGQVNVELTTCPDDCISCSIQNQCDQCAEGYKMQSGRCICFFFFEGKCFEECPSNTRVLINSQFCQNIENQTAVIGVEHQLSQKNFIFEQQQLIGPFKRHEEVSGQFMTQMSAVAIAFELYLFNNFDEYALYIYLNEFQVHDLRSSGFNFTFDIEVLSERKCQTQDNCVVYQLQTYAIDHNTSQPLNISIAINDIQTVIHRWGEHQIIQSDLEWAIRNLTILEFHKTEEPIKGCSNILNNTCYKCLGNTILYNNSCVEICPEGTITDEWECIPIPNYNKYAVILVSQNDLNTPESFLGVKQDFTNDEIRGVVLNGRTYFGGYWAENEFTEVYHLSKHYSLTISAMVKFINSINGYFYVKINGELKSQVFAENNISSDVKMLFNFNHSDSQIMITTGCHDPDRGECYIREYTIVQHLCYPYCLECIGNQKQDCTKFSQKFREFDYINQKCIDGYYLKDLQCQQCHAHNCQICDELDNCIQCQEGYYLRHAKCIAQN